MSVTRGAARATLVEKGWRCFLVKVRNDAGVTAQLRATSRNALPVYARGVSNIPGGFSLEPRPTQKITPGDIAARWLELSMFDKPPLEAKLSGLVVEYRVIQFYSRDHGRREAQLGFDVGAGSQDIGFRNDVPVLFECLPSKDVTLRVLDEDGKPTVASFVIRDRQGRQYPAKTKRLAPDFSFHPQVYREDGEKLRLPAGAYTVEVTRVPEYVARRETLNVSVGARPEEWRFRLKRWIDPAALGWYSGDHHIHAAGCFGDPTIEDSSFERFFNTCVLQTDGVTARTPNAARTAFESCSNPAWALRPANTLANTPLRLANLRQPWAPIFDISINKSFNFSERYRFQVRVESFNTFNTPLFGSPNTSPTDLQFGRLVERNNVRNGNNYRNIQLGLKFNF